MGYYYFPDTCVPPYFHRHDVTAVYVIFSHTVILSCIVLHNDIHNDSNVLLAYTVVNWCGQCVPRYHFSLEHHIVFTNTTFSFRLLLMDWTSENTLWIAGKHLCPNEMLQLLSLTRKTCIILVVIGVVRICCWLVLMASNIPIMLSNSKKEVLKTKSEWSKLLMTSD